MEKAAYKLIFAENPLLDITLEVDEDFLKKYDVKPDNAILAEEKHLPIYQELLVNPASSFSPGGSALNVARATQWMLNKSLPHSTAYFGSVNNDAYFEKLNSAVEKAGVKGIYYFTKDAPTGTCAVLLNKKERSLIANLGACLKFQLSHLKENESVLADSAVIYTTGFFFSSSAESVKFLADYAREHNKIFGINLSATFIIEGYKNELEYVIRNADFVFGNESEFAKFSEVFGYNTSNLEEVATRLAQVPKDTKERPRYVVITQGNLPTIVAHVDPKDPEAKVNLKLYETEKVPQANVVDTNGAGDSFVGGFLSQIAQGKGVEAAIAGGNYIASRVIQVIGCTFPENNDFSL